MKLREFIKDVVFSSLIVISMNLSVLATDLNDKNRISLDQFSEEEQNKIIQELNVAGMADAIEEEHVELADEASEIESVRLAEMAKMTNVGNQRKKGLSLENVKPLTEEQKKSVEDGSYQEEVIVSSESAKSEIDPAKIKATKITEVPKVTDEELKADFRYTITPAQQKKNDDGDVYTNLMNNALKMRIQLEKMFNTKVSASGGQGKLYYVYFAGTTSTDRLNGRLNYSRAFVNSQFSNDLKNNKDALAKLAAETFADIDGTEPYAYQIPTAVYYGLIDVETVSAEKALASKGKYKEGDLLCHANDNLTYAKMSKLTAGYDGRKRTITYGKLTGTEYAYLGNITLMGADTSIITKEMAMKEVVKGEFIEQLMNQSYLIRYTAMNEGDNLAKLAKTFKDTSKFLEFNQSNTCVQDRAFYMNCVANPSKGVPVSTGYALVGANKIGLSIKDSKGNSNWYKKITVGEAISLMQQAASVDE